MSPENLSNHPLFKTPSPEELQSQESQEAVRERLLQHQGSETQVEGEPDDKFVADNNADDDHAVENHLDETGLGLPVPPPAD